MREKLILSLVALCRTYVDLTLLSIVPLGRRFCGLLGFPGRVGGVRVPSLGLCCLLLALS